MLELHRQGVAESTSTIVRGAPGQIQEHTTAERCGTPLRAVCAFTVTDHFIKSSNALKMSQQPAVART